MHAFMAAFGIAMLVLICTAAVLGLVILVMYELRCIAHHGTRVYEREPPPCEHVSDVPPRSPHVLDDYWQN
jgi:hypothetical protein